MGVKTESEYTRMLRDINDRFGSSEVDQTYLKSMKFYCRDAVTRRKLENVKDCLDLFEALEHALKLEKDNVSFLRTLLTNCCKDRKDVIGILDQYEYGREYQGTNLTQHVRLSPTGQRENCPARRGHTLSPYFDVISKEIGKDWRSLARELKLTEVEIEEVTDKYDRNLREQVIEALNVWEEKNHGNVTKYALIDALRKCQKNKLAGTIENM